MSYEYDEEENCIVVPIEHGELPGCFNNKHTFNTTKHRDYTFHLCILCGHSYYEKQS